MTAAVRNVPQPKQASAGDDPGVDARIAAIITDNAGPKAHEAAELSRSGEAPGAGASDADSSVHRPARAAHHPALLAATP
jgi:hypothetical protein